MTLERRSGPNLSVPADPLAAAVEDARKVRMAQAVALIGYWRYHLTTSEMTWSEELYRLLDRDPSEEMTLERARETIHPDDRKQRVEHFDAWTRGEVEFDQSIYRMLTAAGETRYVRGRAILERDDAGAPLAVFGVIQDMTEFEQAARAQREAEERYRLMAETAQDIFIRADLAGRIIYVSPACRILGYEPAEMIGLTGAELEGIDWRNPQHTWRPTSAG